MFVSYYASSCALYLVSHIPVSVSATQIDLQESDFLNLNEYPHVALHWRPPQRERERSGVGPVTLRTNKATQQL